MNNNSRVFPEQFSLAGRSALVTGASSGIGAAIALAFAEAGADVAINFVGDKASAEAVAEEIRALGCRAVLLPGDVGEEGVPGMLIEESLRQFEKLDILVSNAAIQIPEPWHAITPDHIHRQLAVNWQAALLLIQHAAPPMIERRWGRILTVGSVQEVKPHPEMLVYSALKAAQALMVRNLAKQFAPSHVTVNNLAPGVIDTYRSQERITSQDYRQKVLSAIPAGRIGEPSECAGAALLLCSEAGRYITGQTLFVDGGMSL